MRFLKPVIYELLLRWLQITIWMVGAFKEMLLQKIEVYAQVAIFMGHQSSKNKAIFDGFYCEKAHSQHCVCGN